MQKYLLRGSVCCWKDINKEKEAGMEYFYKNVANVKAGTWSDVIGTMIAKNIFVHFVFRNL